MDNLLGKKKKFPSWSCALERNPWKQGRYAQSISLSASMHCTCSAYSPPVPGDSMNLCSSGLLEHCWTYDLLFLHTNKCKQSAILEHPKYSPIGNDIANIFWSCSTLKILYRFLRNKDGSDGRYALLPVKPHSLFPSSGNEWGLTSRVESFST